MIIRSLKELGDLLSHDKYYKTEATARYEHLVQEIREPDRSRINRAWTENYNPDGDAIDDPYDRLLVAWIALGLPVVDSSGTAVTVKFKRLLEDSLPKGWYISDEHLRDFLAQREQELPSFLIDASKAITGAQGLVGYADFIRACQINDPLNDLPGLEVRPDGIYVIPPPSDVYLTPEERATLSEHPERDLSKPVLAFPATPMVVQQFMRAQGLWGAFDEIPLSLAQLIERDGVAKILADYKAGRLRLSVSYELETDSYLENPNDADRTTAVGPGDWLTPCKSCLDAFMQGVKVNDIESILCGEFIGPDGAAWKADNFVITLTLHNLFRRRAMTDWEKRRANKDAAKKREKLIWPDAVSLYGNILPKYANQDDRNTIAAAITTAVDNGILKAVKKKATYADKLVADYVFSESDFIKLAQREGWLLPKSLAQKATDDSSYENSQEGARANAQDKIPDAIVDNIKDDCLVTEEDISPDVLQERPKALAAKIIDNHRKGHTAMNEYRDAGKPYFAARNNAIQQLCKSCRRLHPGITKKEAIKKAYYDILCNCAFGHPEKLATPLKFTTFETIAKRKPKA